jgi:predicted transglutaminase-like cysteine proteinase
LLGVPIEKLRITYVRAELGLPGSGISQAHMVLAYYPTPDGEPLVLDNLVSELRPASRRPDLRPVFGFNSQGLWVAGSRGPSAADPNARLSRWRDLLSRMSADGLT